VWVLVNGTEYRVLGLEARGRWSVPTLAVTEG